MKRNEKVKKIALDVEESEPEETIWQELDRFIDSIGAEIRDENIRLEAIDFWLFKIKRRIDVIHEYIENNNENDKTR